MLNQNQDRFISDDDLGNACLLKWTWDERKERENLQKHKIDFRTAKLVFEDPLSEMRVDPFENEFRWQTIGKVGSILLVVVHTLPETDGERGRIISARKATPHERKWYEEERY